MRKKSVGRQNKLKWKELSEEVRKEHPTCEYCGEKPSSQVHHIISKYVNKSQFRFDRKNLIALCYNCHYNFFHKNPVITMRWFQNNRNDDWIYLIRQLEGK